MPADTKIDIFKMMKPRGATPFQMNEKGEIKKKTIWNSKTEFKAEILERESARAKVRTRAINAEAAIKKELVLLFPNVNIDDVFVSRNCINGHGLYLIVQKARNAGHRLVTFDPVPKYIGRSVKNINFALERHRFNFYRDELREMKGLTQAQTNASESYLARMEKALRSQKASAPTPEECKRRVEKAVDFVVKSEEAGQFFNMILGVNRVLTDEQRRSCFEAAARKYLVYHETEAAPISDRGSLMKIISAAIAENRMMPSDVEGDSA